MQFHCKYGKKTTTTTKNLLSQTKKIENKYNFSSHKLEDIKCCIVRRLVYYNIFYYYYIAKKSLSKKKYIFQRLSLKDLKPTNNTNYQS